MDGPRSLIREELPSLERLVDTVFAKGKQGEMFRMFPTFLAASNAENLLVFVDGGEVVSHVGMARHQACLGGCTIGVACVGAVATYESQRGKSLASQLMEHAIAKASNTGADIMMISGRRSLYTRIGAAEVGLEWDVNVDAQTARDLSFDGVSIWDLGYPDVSFCARAYAGKAAHYIRPAEEWQAFVGSRICMCRDVDILVARWKGIAVAYYVVSHDATKGETQVLELAGDTMALAAGLWPLMERYGTTNLKLRLQQGDAGLNALLTEANAQSALVPTSGTLLVLDFERLMGRLHPLFEARVGRKAAKGLAFTEEDGCFVFKSHDGLYVAKDLSDAAQTIFGYPGRAALDGVLGRILPAPTLWYGLNYV